MKKIANEINDRLKIFDKDADIMDYDGIGSYPFCNLRIDDYFIVPMVAIRELIEYSF